MQFPPFTVKLVFATKYETDDAKIQLIQGIRVYQLRSLISTIIRNTREESSDDICLSANGVELQDEDLLNENTEISVTFKKKIKNHEQAAFLTSTLNYLQMASTSSKPSFSKSTTADPNISTHGVIRNNSDNTLYIYKMKYNHGNEFELELSKEATVGQVIKVISDMRRSNGDFNSKESIVVNLGDERLSNLNVLSELSIPSTVKYFTISIFIDEFSTSNV